MNHQARSSRNRRGVLLLVVLSMLTLFLLLGTAYLVVSSRSRITARAFNRLVMQSDEIRVSRETYLDRTLLHVLRGGTNAAVPASLPEFESLLEDKYGRNTTLKDEAATVTAKGPILKIVTSNLTFLPPSGTWPQPPSPKAGELPGRIVTICPHDGAPTSHRILRAEESGLDMTLWVDSPTTKTPFRVPKDACVVVVNGREFDGQGTTNEAWDGFDSHNPFLARLEPTATSVSACTVKRMSYEPAGGDPCDNDNDGVADSRFLDFGFPQLATASGPLVFDAAVLVIDLDSRINVNAHGSVVTSAMSGTAGLYDSNYPGWPSPAAYLKTTGTTLDDVPTGSGYGPPETNSSWLFRVASGTAATGSRRLQQNQDSVRWFITGGKSDEFVGIRPDQASGGRFSPVATPRLQSVQGRYGESIGSFPNNFRVGSASPATVPGDPLPGRAGVDDAVSRLVDQRGSPTLKSGSWEVSNTDCGLPSLWWDGQTGYNWKNRGGAYNSPPDLHGRMKTLTVSATGTSIVPRLVYAKPEWGDGEATDDPYELLLGPSAAANGWMGDPNNSGFMRVFDNPYSVAELQAVLRPYDIDASRLPMRLAGTLGALAEEARLRITTTSWDTTAITGTAAAHLGKWIRRASNFKPSTGPLDGSLGGEVARWERFDLNRPLTGTKPHRYMSGHPYYAQRQAYFKDLYTLVCAVLHPNVKPTTDQAKEYAQWVANVIEFRDADSTMTPFEYDADPSDGWTPDGDVETDDRTAGGLVWGAERPEILIMETCAWEDDKTGELYVVLHRPWNSDALSATGTVAGEPVDVAFDTVPPRNVVDLGRKSGTSAPTDSDAYPIWRLRIEDAEGNKAFVRFDPVGTAPTGDLSASAVQDQASTPKMAPDSWLCVLGGTSLAGLVSTSGTVTIDRGGAFRVPGPLPDAYSTPPREATIYLERLTDPNVQVSGTTWAASSGGGAPPPHYHVVDQANVAVVNRMPRGPLPPDPLKKVTRKHEDDDGGSVGADASVWPPEFGAPQAFEFLGHNSFQKAKTMWLPWPNRPFTSAVELALVPGTKADNIKPGRNAVATLEKYRAASPTNNFFRAMHDGAGLERLALLEAVHVPTRFAGIHRTIATDPTNAMDDAGIYLLTTPVNQLSSYREPGRVNLNTITSDDVWCATVAGSLRDGSSGNPWPITPRTSGSGQAVGSLTPGQGGGDFVSTPAKSMGEMLLLSLTSGTTLDLAKDTHPVLAVSGSLNPAHQFYTANRLANTATIRSNVFAIWVTLRERIVDDPDSVRYHRAFYVVDRSIPVAHVPGTDLNAWDAVVLRRIIE